MTTPPLDLDHLRQWIGRTHTDRDTAATRHARLMAATVDRPGPLLQDGDALPPLWHWLYFLEGQPPSALGRDGHPARGGCLPPVPLPNRMWAGGRVHFEHPLRLGAVMDKRSEVLDVRHKQGRSGDLVFVTVQHEVFSGGRRCVREEHDIVYKAAAASAQGAAGGERATSAQGRPADATASAPPPAVSASTAPPAAAAERTVTPDATMLFRYSALTFNGHRIHYDADYCRSVEGYDQLVIHGPLQATLLAGWAQELGGGRALRRFDYRGVSPALLGQTLTLQAMPPGGPKLALWTALAGGLVSMQAEAEYGALGAGA